MPLVTVFGFPAIRMFREPRGPVTENSLKLAVLAYSCEFRMQLLIDFGSRRGPNVSGTPRCGYGELVKTHTVGLFWPVFYAISHCFWVSPRYECFGNPGVRLPKTRYNSQFWPILVRFVCNYSLIFGSAGIRTFRKPRGPVTGNSSKLAV